MLYKNLPERNFRLKLFTRKLFDGAAAIMFLFKAEFKCFFAVIRAHVHYYRAIPDLRHKRKSLLNPVRDFISVPVLNKSIVFEFYVKQNRTFSAINPEFKNK